MWPFHLNLVCALLHLNSSKQDYIVKWRALHVVSQHKKLFEWLSLISQECFSVPAAKGKTHWGFDWTHDADFEPEETKAKIDYGTEKHKQFESVILHKA